MEINPGAGPAAHEVDARALYSAKLAALAAGKSGAETISGKKRGTFLARKFFGSKDKEPVHEPEGGTINVAARPAAPPPNPDEGSAHGLILMPTVPAEAPAAVPMDIVDSPQGVPDADFPDSPPHPAPRITVPTSRASHAAMTPTDTTTAPFATGPASVQLTLGFEITSLQLTPFFKLGSVQLKALSNVVSLRLVTAAKDGNPLAAGISFEVERADLDSSGHLKSLVLKPLGEARADTAPLPRLQVDAVAVAGAGEDAPISVTTSRGAPTAVQVFGAFAVAELDFDPVFDLVSLRLEPASRTVLLRVAPSSLPTAQDLPPSFEIAEVQLADDARISGLRVVPSAAGNA